jgi:O-acetyl-ADP-ribose deacetylase
MPAVEIVNGDLLDQQVEVIVNAWNRNFIPWWLLLPQGVSGAIKRRGGYQPFRELAAFGTLKAGEARLTSAGRLPFRAIIHVAALNVWWRSSPEIIRSGVTNALALASEQGFASVAMPLLGSGTGGVKPLTAQSVIVTAVHASTFPGRVRIVRYAPASDRGACPVVPPERNAWRPSTPPVPDAEWLAHPPGDITLIHVWAHWNGYDRAFDHELQEAIRMFGPRVSGHSLDVDDPAFRSVIMAWGVTSVPSLVVFANGEHRATLRNLRQSADIVSAVRATAPEAP